MVVMDMQDQEGPVVVVDMEQVLVPEEVVV
jgi:hypothetical protein